MMRERTDLAPRMNDAPETPVPHDLCGQLIRHLNAMTDKSVTVFDIVHLLRERAYALLVLILALPNAVPGPFIPGLSTITGIPALIFAFEAALGRPHPRLPARVGKFKLNRAKMIGHLIRARPYTMNLETVMRPRLSAVSGRVRLAFLWCGWLALVFRGSPPPRPCRSPSATALRPGPSLY